MCFNTQPPEGGCRGLGGPGFGRCVSTHSRPKAAALVALVFPVGEGQFQHTAARRRLQPAPTVNLLRLEVSTHSRPKAAAHARVSGRRVMWVFQHTAARRRLPGEVCIPGSGYGFNTQPPEGGCPRPVGNSSHRAWFQHTAARRRLLVIDINSDTALDVSTHSRPKAAASASRSALDGMAGFQHTAARRRLLPRDNPCKFVLKGFNTQPPEGGCYDLWLCPR